MILTMNNFTFNQQHYLQIHCTAMVLKWLLLLLAFFLVCSKLTLSLTPFVGSLPHGEDILMIFYDLDRRSRFLKIFVDYLSNIHPTIKFTSSHSLTNVPFFDVMVSLHNGIIETDLFTKATDKHQHLLSSSCHPHHTKKAVPFSLALRLRRICSTDVKFKLKH